MHGYLITPDGDRFDGDLAVDDYTWTCAAARAYGQGRIGIERNHTILDNAAITDLHGETLGVSHKLLGNWNGVQIGRSGHDEWRWHLDCYQLGTMLKELPVPAQREPYRNLPAGVIAKEALRLALGDAPPEEDGWRVEIVGYDSPGGPASAIVRLANCAVATSGDLFQRVEFNGVRYSHIVDPFTCVGLTNHALATVIAKDGMTADSLATVMTITERKKAFGIAKKWGAAARVVRLEDGRPVVEANGKFQRLIKE